MSISLKRAHNTPESKAKKREAARVRWQNPAHRAEQSARARTQWADPTFKKRVLAKINRTNNTPEVKAKFKAATEALWQDPVYRAKHSAGMARPECKAKMSANAIAQWCNPKQRRNHLEGYAKRYRREASNLELAIKLFLDANFADVIHQYVPNEDMSPGIFDFYIPAIDTIVEVDGNYWHSMEEKQERDLEKELWAIEHEYGFVRIKEDNAKDPKFLNDLLKEMRMY